MANYSVSDDDVFVFEKAVIPRKRTEDLPEEMQEGRHIHNKGEELSEVTPIKLALATGYPLKRIKEHICWALDKGYGKRKN